MDAITSRKRRDGSVALPTAADSHDTPELGPHDEIHRQHRDALVERVLMWLGGVQLYLPKKRTESPRARHPSAFELRLRHGPPAAGRRASPGYSCPSKLSAGGESPHVSMCILMIDCIAICKLCR